MEFLFSTLTLNKDEFIDGSEFFYILAIRRSEKLYIARLVARFQGHCEYDRSKRTVVNLEVGLRRKRRNKRRRDRDRTKKREREKEREKEGERERIGLHDIPGRRARG